MELFVPTPEPEGLATAGEGLGLNSINSNT
jgi:hypothetical protein